MARMCTSKEWAIILCTLSMCVVGSLAGVPGVPSGWKAAHATFYGGSNAQGTMGGACGYGNLYNTGYGLETAALSSTLFNNGKTCGACYEMFCNYRQQSRWCYKAQPHIKVTATNLCPANWNRPTNRGGWCNPPRVHFDLPQPMFIKMARYVGGIVPVAYRRVPCVKKGGVKFTMNGNPWFNLILISNVAGPGDIKAVAVKGSKQKSWTSARQNWGQKWEVKQKLQGQALSFRLTSGSGKVLVLYNAVPRTWRFGSTYMARSNWKGL
ncbi:expansin [Marchantia polymorpha subsp. ruderalis]|uniref:Expansin n=2 Tax=Marchantia polymorpha TaxID=3197 RepID=A0A176WQB7_MARPO|nr:hypothetical protein AXG93_700s1150 [Marchantia polymorpha subsp. ruderalis]PTQ30019.1 hypothetical protein MARPO_0131s0018 [Marchantia polymorpha]BBN20409.1 hypothetical protein Mp_8g18860 [Marchantia polymorpha subsp. ruderalis]|eukprot:PTQ30019.1 hypothetical protein MARPO_0131s0018 [Marchantia polymorpha]